MTEGERYSISTVADMLGVSPPTIRRWEELIGITPTRFGPGQSRVYSRSDVELLRKVQELKDQDGFTLDQIAKFFKKLYPQVQETAATALLPVEAPQTPGEIMNSEEVKELARQMLGQMVQEATDKIKVYVDEQIDKVNHNMSDVLDKAITRIDRLSEERSRQIMQQMNEMLERRKNRSLFKRIFS